MIGCGNEVPNANGGDSQESVPPPKSADAGFPKLTRKWRGSDGLEEAKSVGPVLGGPGSLKFVDEFFQESEWGRPETEPVIAIELDDANSLELHLSPRSAADQTEFVALWERPGPMLANTTSSVVKQSRGLNGAEQAIDLLRLYVRRKGDVASSVEWEDQ